jgi:hypothetical protein
LDVLAAAKRVASLLETHCSKFGSVPGSEVSTEFQVQQLIMILLATGDATMQLPVGVSMPVKFHFL